SRLTSFTAGKPSPYCLTMFFIVMAAIRPRSFLSVSVRSALDRTLGEAGYDLPLEQQHDEHDGDGHDHRGRSDGAGRVLELRSPGEEGQRSRHGTGGLRRGQGDAVDEVVPGDEERDQC